MRVKQNKCNSIVVIEQDDVETCSPRSGERKRSSLNEECDQHVKLMSKDPKLPVWGVKNVDGSTICYKSCSSFYSEALILNISLGNKPLVKSLLASKEVNINQGDQNGYTPQANTVPSRHKCEPAR
jgi:hypothetical protein